ncbi:MAG: transposase [Deltaproteobacteria bacterium]|nr:transposase [Deltaproteobacteria bacterium]
MNEEQRTELALWRVGVLGPLVSAELGHGDVVELCREAAERSYRRPDGRYVELKPRTIMGWHYAYRRKGLDGLKPRGRTDAGRSRAIAPALAERLVALKREQPRRSIRSLIRMLERDGAVSRGELKRSTVHRLLKAHGVSTRPPRERDTERRAFRHRYAGDCWMGDVMHGPQALDAHGRARKAYLHAFVDSATRLVTGCAFRFGERAVDFEGVLKDAIRKHGVPRTLLVDNGAAQVSGSLRVICGELGVHLTRCKPYDAAAKGGVERFFRTWRAEVGDELPDAPLPLAELNARTWAWLSTEYHRRRHGGTERVPLEHWLGQTERLRPPPAGGALDRVFLHREQRRVRRDGTVRFRGHLLEVRGELVGEQLELRFDPSVDFAPDDSTTWPDAYVDGVFACDTVLLDRVANSTRPRRRLPKPADTTPPAPTGIDPLRQMADEQARLTRRPADLSTERDKEE